MVCASRASSKHRLCRLREAYFAGIRARPARVVLQSLRPPAERA
jgi:hypothetical protein